MTVTIAFHKKPLAKHLQSYYRLMKESGGSFVYLESWPFVVLAVLILWRKRRHGTFNRSQNR